MAEQIKEKSEVILQINSLLNTATNNNPNY